MANTTENCFINFELTTAEAQELRGLEWGRGRLDLMCQGIVRDYLRRMRHKAARHARRIDRAADGRRDAGPL